jgi:hypothetical protein
MRSSTSTYAEKKKKGSANRRGRETTRSIEETIYATFEFGWPVVTQRVVPTNFIGPASNEQTLQERDHN